MRTAGIVFLIPCAVKRSVLSLPKKSANGRSMVCH